MPSVLAKQGIIMQGKSYVLPEVWVRPPFAGKGRKVTGSLESHANGFRYQNPKGETLDIMYRSVFPLAHGNSWEIPRRKAGPLASALRFTLESGCLKKLYHNQKF